MFQQLRTLYSDPAKTIIIEQMLISFVQALERTGRFPPGQFLLVCTVDSAM